ncbi:MAG: Tm-1-like ATP-binding domain-containing protein [Actinomycetota bacterium]|nr:Tm-1-like ATP-binding domain-containing protein [Actinomycetota bacterium]
MSKTIVIAGAFDTKGSEFAFLNDLIKAHDIKTLTIDIGVIGNPGFTPDINNGEVAKAGGSTIEILKTKKDKTKAMRVMSDGLSVIVNRLYEQGKLNGILSMGGSGGTALVTTAMRNLPVGIPKIMVSTMAGGDVSSYVGTSDIIMVPSVVDVAGINRISRKIYSNAAEAIVGMVKAESFSPVEEKPLIAASMFGNTTKCIDQASANLNKKGYETVVFHAVGTGGRTMEKLIGNAYFEGVLDLTTTELADEVCGGLLSAGPDRLKAAPNAGIPVVIAPGCIDMANFFGKDTIPEKYKNRNLYEWNPNITLMRTNIEENIKIGQMIATAANLAKKGKVVVILPLKGVSMLDSKGNPFWDQDADQACYNAIKDNLRSDIPIVEIDCNINDKEFSDKATELLEKMIKNK